MEYLTNFLVIEEDYKEIFRTLSSSDKVCLTKEQVLTYFHTHSSERIFFSDDHREFEKLVEECTEKDFFMYKESLYDHFNNLNGSECMIVSLDHNQLSLVDIIKCSNTNEIDFRGVHFYIESSLTLEDNKVYDCSFEE